MTTIAVVGLSLAGLRAAQALRGEGYDGDLVLVGDEGRLPYDRPPLSKELLSGSVDPDRLLLADAAERDALDAEWLIGRRATALRPGWLRVEGQEIAVDGVVIATGARARSWPADVPEGVHVLRTLDDALALRADLDRARHVVVLGGGFIGTEIASAAVSRGRSVSIVDPSPSPLARKVGPTVAHLLERLHAERGVDLHLGRAVATIGGRTRVTHVELTDGTRLPADVVVVGIGTLPNVEWLRSSGVRCDDGVVTDAWGRTSVPQIVAAGDVARRPSARGSSRSEHWTSARDTPALAVRALLADLAGRDLGQPPALEPYFWSDQFGVRLQVAGEVDPSAPLDIVHGHPREDVFVATQAHRNVVVGWNCPREFTRARRARPPAA